MYRAWTDIKGREFSLASAFPLIMGVLNVSRDSFSDGGRYMTPEAAVAAASKMISEGAAIIDMGAESTRPSAAPIGVEEELNLLVPQLEAVRRAFPKIPISVDTYKPETARAALEKGADIINDVIVARSGRRCPMAELAAERGCPIVAVHNSRGEDCGENFFDFLMDGLSDIVSFVENEGVPRSKIIIDPGFGFGKTEEQNFEILARLGELRKFGCAVLLGVSRKSSLAALVGESMDVRDAATVAVTAISSAMKSADIVRVHDVAKNAAAAKVAREIMKWTKANTAAMRPNARRLPNLRCR